MTEHIPKTPLVTSPCTVLWPWGIFLGQTYSLLPPFLLHWITRGSDHTHLNLVPSESLSLRLLPCGEPCRSNPVPRVCITVDLLSQHRFPWFSSDSGQLVL